MTRNTDWLFVPSALVGALCLALVALWDAGAIEADQPDVLGAIHAAAQNHEVPAAPLIELARCESAGTFDPDAKGDYRWRGGRFVPTSRGVYQLNELPGTGLYYHFKREYPDNDSTDVEAVSDYVARVAKGEFAREGVTLARWSCWSLVR